MTPPHLQIPIKLYSWTPQPDITVYELAKCVPVFGISNNWLREVSAFIEGLPEECRRHFTEVKR